jgi:uncharacterized protein YbjT (DUF2867 family)
MGVQVVTGDVNHPHTLRQAVEGVSVVVSALQGGPDIVVHGQANLLKAAQDAGVKKFIASTFSLNLFNVPYGEHEFLDSRKKFAERLEKSGMPYVHILNGCFTETFWGFLGVFKKQGPVLQYYGDGTEKFDVTTFDDTARYTAEAALDPSITGVVEVAGDSITMEEAAEAYRKVKGDIKTEKLGGLDDLKMQIRRRQNADRTNYASYIPLKYQLFMLDGRGKLTNIANSKFPSIKAHSMVDYLKKAEDIPEPGY